MKNHPSARLIIFLLTAIILTSFLSCEKKKNVRTIYLPQEFKDYMYFKDGTYWIYQDSVTLENDSNYIIMSKIEILKDYKENGPNQELFDYWFKSSNNIDSVEYIGSSACFSEAPSNNVCFYASKFLSSGGSTYIFYYPPIVGHQTSPNGFTKVTLTHIYDSLEIEGNTYHDVIRMHETKNASENNKETAFYIAKNYGIIRKEINQRNATWEPDNWQVWNLVRSHIIQ